MATLNQGQNEKRSLAESLERVMRLSSKWITLISMLGLLLAILNTYLVYTNMYIVTTLLDSGEWQALYSVIALMLILFSSLALIATVQTVASQRFSHFVGEQLTAPALLAVAQHDNHAGFNLSVVAEDLEVIRETLSRFFGKAIVSIALAPAMLPLSFLIHWAFGLVVCVFCVEMAFTSFALFKLLRERELVSTVSSAKVFGLTVDAMRSGEAVLAMGMLPRLGRWWLETSVKSAVDISKAEERVARMQLLNNVSVSVLQGAFLFVFAGIQFAGSEINGIFAGATLIVAQFLGPFSSFGSMNGKWVNFGTTWKRIQQLAEYDREANSQGFAFPCPEGRLIIENLRYRYGPSMPSLFSGVNLTAIPGQLCAIVGMAGSGKTTLIQLMLGLKLPLMGGIYLDGHATNQWNRHDLSRHIGYLPQQPKLERGTIAEVIARFEQPEMERVVEAAHLAGADEIISKLPYGYTTLVGGQYQFSVGQRQRIAIARALYGNPKVLIFDELDSSLDDDGIEKLVPMLRHLSKAGRLVIFTTSHPALLNAADRVLVLRNGSLTPASLTAA